VLFEVTAPRNDTARRVVWNLGARAGTPVVLEVVDGDPGASYAWLAFGRIEPSSVPSPGVAPATVVQRQIAAAELIQAVGLEAMKPAMAAMAQERGADLAARAAAIRALTSDALMRAAAELVSDVTQPMEWRERTADSLFSEDRSGAGELVADVWKGAPQRFQVAFAALATARPELASTLVAQLEDGKAPAGLLMDRRLRERLRQVIDDGDKAVLDRLVKGLPEEDPAAQKLLDERRAGYRGATVDVVRGKELFTAACAACHQINGEGGLVGPQLTGIGTRGAERLCEDILVPNRNVDHAFWTTVLTLKDDETVSGLFRREEGELLVLANAAGTEFTVPKSEVASRKESNLSVMPSNFGDAMPAPDFYHMLAYLLSQTGK
jgi:putative heme-binding domain-containing protein